MGTVASGGTSSTAVEALQRLENLGRYRVLARLGQGGMGTIHLAVAGGLADFRKLLVVKELRPELTSNDRFVEMFLVEAKLAARLDHPNIVQTLEAGQDGDRYYLAMEFLDGQPLVEILKRVDARHVVPPGLLIQILADVLAGLHYAHELCDYDETPLHIVHRDVNPQNVFVTYHGHVKLVDFGIAKVVDSEVCTTAGVFKGKFPYAAPEQVNCQKVDRRADVFAVGVMLWEILAQRRFAPGQPTTEAIDARLAGAEPRISAVRPDIDPELAAICDHAMQVDPALRYPTAEEFRQDLLDFLASRTEMNTNFTLGDLMRREFAAERSAAHRVISSQVRKLMPDEDLGDSLVRVLTRSGTSPGITSNEPLREGTLGAATPTDRDGSKMDTAPSRRAGQRRSDPMLVPPPMELQSQVARMRSRKARLATVGTVAICAFVGAYFAVRAGVNETLAGRQSQHNALTRTDGQVERGPTESGAQALYRDTLPADHGKALEAEPKPAGSNDADRAPSAGPGLAPELGASMPAADPAVGSSAASERAARREARRLRADKRMDAPSSERAGTASGSVLPRAKRARQAVPGPKAASSSDEGVASTEARASQRSHTLKTTSPPTSTSAKVAPQPATARPLAVGDDLRVLRQPHRPRPLQLEDPFQ